MEINNNNNTVTDNYNNIINNNNSNNNNNTKINKNNTTTNTTTTTMTRSSVWLDAKKSTAQRIRQRRREQQQLQQQQNRQKQQQTTNFSLSSSSSLASSSISTLHPINDKENSTPLYNHSVGGGGGGLQIVGVTNSSISKDNKNNNDNDNDNTTVDENNNNNNNKNEDELTLPSNERSSPNNKVSSPIQHHNITDNSSTSSSNPTPSSYRSRQNDLSTYTNDNNTTTKSDDETTKSEWAMMEHFQLVKDEQFNNNNNNNNHHHHHQTPTGITTTPLGTFAEPQYDFDDSNYTDDDNDDEEKEIMENREEDNEYSHLSSSLSPSYKIPITNAAMTPSNRSPDLFVPPMEEELRIREQNLQDISSELWRLNQQQSSPASGMTEQQQQEEKRHSLSPYQQSRAVASPITPRSNQRDDRYHHHHPSSSRLSNTPINRMDISNDHITTTSTNFTGNDISIGWTANSNDDSLELLLSVNRENQFQSPNDKYSTKFINDSNKKVNKITSPKQSPILESQDGTMNTPRGRFVHFSPNPTPPSSTPGYERDVHHDQPEEDSSDDVQLVAQYASAVKDQSLEDYADDDDDEYFPNPMVAGLVSRKSAAIEETKSIELSEEEDDDDDEWPSSQQQRQLGDSLSENKNDDDDDEEVSSPPLSLLQESLIPSDLGTITSTINDNFSDIQKFTSTSPDNNIKNNNLTTDLREDNSTSDYELSSQNRSFLSFHDNSTNPNNTTAITQLSMLSLQPSTGTSEVMLFDTPNVVNNKKNNSSKYTSPSIIETQLDQQNKNEREHVAAVEPPKTSLLRPSLTINTSSPTNRSHDNTTTSSSPHNNNTSKSANIDHTANSKEERGTESNTKTRATESADSKLHKRVAELEQALKATVLATTTPREGTLNTPSQAETPRHQNPLATLLERNKTLVKEVRFADQTCVELSSKNSALLTEVELLQEQLQQAHQETEILRTQLTDGQTQEQEDVMEIEQLKSELRSAHETIEQLEHKQTVYPPQQDESFLSGLDVSQDIRNALDELKVEVSALHEASSPQHELSDDEDEEETNESFTNHVLALELQKQVRRLRLQRQNIQTSLEESKNHSRFTMESVSTSSDKCAINEQILKKRIQSLEVQLERATNQMYLYHNGPTSPRLKFADQRVFALEKQLAHAQASLVATKRQLEKQKSLGLSNNPDTNLNNNNKDEEIKRVVKRAVTGMIKQYQELEKHVQTVTGTYSDRMERLVDTVTFLRSSLLFENESVMTIPKIIQEQNSKNQNYMQDTTQQRILMNASIPGTTGKKQMTHEDEDELLELMEEARSPQSIRFLQNSSVVVGDEENNNNSNNNESNASFVSDDLSRLYADDATWDTNMNNPSNNTTTTSTPTRYHKNESFSVASTPSISSEGAEWRARLESTLKECQRVRDVLIKVQKTFAEETKTWNEQLKEKQRCVEQLESENGRLSLEASRRSQETSSLQTKVSELQSHLEQAKIAKDYVQSLEDTKLDLEDEIRQLQEQLQSRNDAFDSLTMEQSKLQDNYNTTTKSLEESRRECTRLMEEHQLSTKETIQKHNEENDLLRQALMGAESEVDELKKQLETIQEKLETTIQMSNQYQQTVSDLTASRQEFFSQAEDRVLEMQYKLEEVRKERAELKATLGNIETDFRSTKQVLSSTKQKSKHQLEKRDALIDNLQTQQEQLTYKMKQLQVVREELETTLQSAGLVLHTSDRAAASMTPKKQPEMLSHGQERNESNNGRMTTTKLFSNEVLLWKELIPSIGASVKSISKNQQLMDTLEEQMTQLSKELNKHELAEVEFKQQLENERQQNEQLVALLRQAEVELLRSTDQIKEMNMTINNSRLESEQLQQTNHVMEEEYKTLNTHYETTIQELTAQCNDRQTKLEAAEQSLRQLEVRVSETTQSLSSTREELDQTKEAYQGKVTNERKLEQLVNTLENKGSKLRGYIRKLTQKCEEWEESYDRQAHALDKLAARNSKRRQQQTHLAHKYKELTNKVHKHKQVHQHDRDKWTYEKSTFQQVHGQLEEELEVIAKELDNITNGANNKPT